MVTAAQLQILQSPITNLISTISTSVNVKLDDANYLNWNFQMKLLLESNDIYGFVDGSHPCPAPLNEFGTNISNSTSSSGIDCDDMLIWRMHDRALMQLITATLSPVAMSCAIGSGSSKELWLRLKKQFSTVSKTSIFQMKSNLQNIRKGMDTISQYLLKIKEARDYLAVAGVFFVDEDIVILALNGLPPEYNTFRCVVRGRESVITLKEFRSQLLAEELIVDNHMSASSTYLSALHTTAKPQSHLTHQFHSSRGQHSSNSYANGGYKSFNRNRGRGRPNYTARTFPPKAPFPTKTPFMSQGTYSPSQYTASTSINSVVCQLCNNEGHTAPSCGSRGYERIQCTICGKPNHATWYCFYNVNGPNFVGSASDSSAPPSQHHALHAMHHTNPSNQPDLAPHSPSMWLTDTGATNHMTADLSNLTLSTPYPTTDAVHTANGEGLSVSHVGSAIIPTSSKPLLLKSVLCVLKLTQNLLFVHRIYLDNNCYLIFDAFCFWIQDKATGRIMYKGQCSNGLYPMSFASSRSLGRFQSHAYIGQLVVSSTWHHRLGHPSNKIVSLMLQKANIQCSPKSSTDVCISCLEGKFCKPPFPSRLNTYVTAFNTIHSDLWGPSPQISLDGYKYYVIFVDEYTRYCWLFPLVNKSDVFSVFTTFYTYVHTQFSSFIQVFQSDGGVNLLATLFRIFLKLRVLYTTSLALILLNKMGWLKENIDILWKPLLLYCNMQICHLLFGHMLYILLLS